MRRSLSCDSILILNFSQGGQDLFAGGHSCEKQSAQRPHEDGKRDPDQHDFRANAKIECDLAERDETADSCGDVVQRRTSSRQPIRPPMIASSNDSSRKLKRMLPREQARAESRFLWLSGRPRHT